MFFTPRRTPGKGTKLESYESESHSFRIPVNYAQGPHQNVGSTPQKQVRSATEIRSPPTPESPTPPKLYPSLAGLDNFPAFHAPASRTEVPQDDPFQTPTKLSQRVDATSANSRPSFPLNLQIAGTPLLNRTNNNNRGAIPQSLKPEDLADLQPITLKAPPQAAESQPRVSVPPPSSGKPRPKPRPSSQSTPHPSPAPPISASSSQSNFSPPPSTNAPNASGSANPLPGFKPHVSLYPHQRTGIAWMVERENPLERKWGGVNADVMGAGKTHQLLGLISLSLTRPEHVELRKECTAPTLVVCPASIVWQWEKHTKEYTNLKCNAYHGPERGLPKTRNITEQYDVIITSYHTLLHEYKSFEKSPDELKKQHPIYGRKWYRVVLDESHNIKNPKAQTGRAIQALDVVFRWGVTGTPIQNSVLDLYPIFKFIKHSPYDDRVIFDRELFNPLKGVSDHPIAVKLLRDILKQTMIRRTKQDVLPFLPPRSPVNLIKCKFSPAERTFYDMLDKRGTEVVEFLIKKGAYQSVEEGGEGAMGGKGFYNCVLVILLRLRQACQDPKLILNGGNTKGKRTGKKTGKKTKTEKRAAVSDNDDEGAEEEEEEYTEEEYVLDAEKCKICQAPLPGSSTPSTYCENCSSTILPHLHSLTKQGRRSTKIMMLMKILSGILNRKSTLTKEAAPDKVVVVSQWTSMLDIVGEVLDEEGFGYVHYRGSMTIDQRRQALETIEKDANIKVILLSLCAGGTGLNLTACNHLVLLDQWWNPAIEEQAFDRIHRIGQRKPVFIYKLVIESPTVEDRILEIQERKRQLADNILSKEGSKTAKANLNMGELLAFFPHLSKRAVNKVLNGRK